MLNMHYVYITQSKVDKSHYVGSTTNPEQRLYDHNEGSVRYTKSKRPWDMIWFCAFTNKEKALEFEKYLKHGSGHAFAKKHLI